MEAQLNMTGWVGSEVEFRHTQPTGTSRATFRLACTPRVRRQGRWTDDPTTWLTVTCWRSLAEHVASSLGKGEPVLVIGRLRTQAWDDDQDAKHERLVLDAISLGHDLSKGTAAFRRGQRNTPRIEDRPQSGTDDTDNTDPTAAQDSGPPEPDIAGTHESSAAGPGSAPVGSPSAHPAAPAPVV